MALTLPDDCCQMTFAAFRAGFVVAFDALLTEVRDPETAGQPCQGLFACFPLLDGTAPQIQLEALLRTWARHLHGYPGGSELLDECVEYAALECLARIANDDSRMRLHLVLNTPAILPLKSDLWITSRARCLQVAGARPLSEDFLRELSCLDQRGRHRHGEFSNPPVERDELLDIVGRWSADRDILLTSEMLLTSDEQSLLRSFFEEHPGLLRS